MSCTRVRSGTSTKPESDGTDARTAPATAAGWARSGRRRRRPRVPGVRRRVTAPPCAWSSRTAVVTRSSARGSRPGVATRSTTSARTTTSRPPRCSRRTESSSGWSRCPHRPKPSSTTTICPAPAARRTAGCTSSCPTSQRPRRTAPGRHRQRPSHARRRPSPVSALRRRRGRPQRRTRSRRCSGGEDQPTPAGRRRWHVDDRRLPQPPLRRTHVSSGRRGRGPVY